MVCFMKGGQAELLIIEVKIYVPITVNSHNSNLSSDVVMSKVLH